MTARSALMMPARTFLGRAKCRVEAQGLAVYESDYPAGTSLRPHAHENAHFCYVLEGEYQETIEGHDHARGPGTLIYYPPLTRHAEKHCTAGRHALIEFDPSWAGRHGLCVDPGKALACSAAAITGIARQLSREAHRPDGATPLVIDGLVMDLMSALHRGARRDRANTGRWIESVRRMLDERFREFLSLSDLADAVGVHPAHLTRAFRHRYGCSIGAYVRRRRLEYACRRILDSPDPLCAIALDAGFADQCHLTRAVRKSLGQTPASLRRQSRRVHIA